MRAALPAYVRLPLVAAFAFLLSFSLLAGPADAKKRKKRVSTLPTVTDVTPAKAAAGDVLVLKGKNFKIGTGKNTVVFRKASGGKFIFAPTLTATATRLTLKVPATLNGELDVLNGAQQQTRFQLRVVGARASAFTTVGKSPIILPASVGLATSDCDKDGVPDSADADDDNDGLSDAIEVQYGLNTCSVDTDGDGIWDSYEFESALDLNVRSLPYPGKKPWPNPLDATDANSDFDGDGLTMAQEHKLWQAAGRPFPLNYSDGDQYTGGPVAAPSPDVNVLDRDAVIDPGPASLRTGVGYLSDDEKDFDGDGLSNQAEFSGALTQGYWKAINVSRGEHDYTLRPFSDLDPTDPDSDGDGVLDGYDDQDADGWNNISEEFRFGTAATNNIAYMVNPFNPCLPDWRSRTCSRYIPAQGQAWTPFDLKPVPPAPIGWDVANQLPTPQSPTPDYVPGG